MQPVIETVIGILSEDLENEDFERIFNNHKYDDIMSFLNNEIESNKDFSIIVLESNFDTIYGFESTSKINNIKVDKNKYDDILIKYNLIKYKDKIDIYQYPREI